MSTPQVLGVDVAVSYLALALAPLDVAPIRVETLDMRTDATQGERLGHIDRTVRAWANRLEQAVDAVWVEQPSGRFRAPALVYTTGVVQAALYETLRCPVWTVPSSKWKRATVGAGNATKAQVRAWVDQRAQVDSQDEADAYCIAVAGRAMLTSGSWEAAA